ncbi:hypothetical protein [Oceanisphaera sp. KMM 10153]|uniref:hypothetical protein n=1 Tax=Oceanisphaera submarina TaxID=3390193 RepID=UPI003976E41A
MKTPSIALFLALSAGYLEAASAEPLPNKAQQADKKIVESSGEHDSVGKQDAVDKTLAPPRKNGAQED